MSIPMVQNFFRVMNVQIRNRYVKFIFDLYFDHYFDCDLNDRLFYANNVLITSWLDHYHLFDVCILRVLSMKARLVKKRVTKLMEIKKDGQFTSYRLTDSTEETRHYDAVILAVPCTVRGCGNIEFRIEGIEAKLT